MTRPRILSPLTALAVLVVGLPAVPRPVPQSRTPQQSFNTHCASCHARDGSGKTAVGKSLKTQDLRAPETLKKKDEELSTIVREGKKNMPAFKTLTDGEVQELIAYLRQLARKK